MQKTKRKERDKCTEHLTVKRNACKEAPVPGPICSDTTFKVGLQNIRNSSGISWSEVDDDIAVRMPETVVSLASFIGDTMLSECTGVCIESLSVGTTNFLTSASLVTSSDPESKISNNLTIKVRLPNGQVVIGSLLHHDSNHGIAVVNIKRVRGFCAKLFWLHH